MGGTIKKRLEKVGGADPYRDIKQVAADVAFVFDNAILYNPKEHDIHKVALNLKRVGEILIPAVFAVMEIANLNLLYTTVKVNVEVNVFEEMPFITAHQII